MSADPTQPFGPRFPEQWAVFRDEIADFPNFHSFFGGLTEQQSEEIWLYIEENYLSKYDYLLRVWAEWGSTGLWGIRYPGSRTVRGVYQYDDLGLSPDLRRRIQEWHGYFEDDCRPWERNNQFDYARHRRLGNAIAADLKRETGEGIYVEFHELVEVMIDGTARLCRPELSGRV